MKWLIKICFTICFSFSIVLLLTSCNDKSEECRITKYSYPSESFILTDLSYSNEKGVQVAGFSKSSPNKIVANVYSYIDEKTWKEEYEESFDCSVDTQIEAQIFWSNKGGVIIPYTWKHADDPFEEIFYYVNPNGFSKEIENKEFTCISDMCFSNKNKIFWVNYEDFLLREWNSSNSKQPRIVKLTNVNSVNQIGYYDEYIYVVGFAGDSTIINTLDGKELPTTQNLENLSKDIFDSGISGNEFLFGVFKDQEASETLFYADASGIWRYKDGEKKLLLSGADAGFGTETYFTDIAIQNKKTIYIDFLRIENGVGISEMICYQFD